MRLKLIPLLAILSLAFPAAALASSRQFMVYEAPTELLHSGEATRQATLDEISGFGVHWLRIVLYWRDVAPAPESHHVPSFDERDPAQYDWGSYDAAIRDARAKGFKILLTVTAPAPTWATYHHSDEQGTHRPSATRFQRFMTAVGKHYGDDVDYWAIWNEPNHPDFLTPQFSHGKPVAGKIYRDLFFAGYRGIMADDANRHDRVLMGETAPVGTSHVVAPLQFMRGALCLDSHFRKRSRSCRESPAFGWAHHAYTRKSGPYYNDPRHPDNVVIGDLDRLNHALARAGASGAIRRGAGIYLTEFGIQSKPDPFYGVSYHTQAEYRAISEWIAFHNGRVRAFSQYLMRDDRPRDTKSALERYGGFESGLRTSGGTIKEASYDAFPIPLVALKEGRSRPSIRLWGIVRPADELNVAPTKVKIDYRNPGSRTWRYLKSDTTKSTGAWESRTRYRRGRDYRVRWTSPAGREYVGPTTQYHSVP